MTFRTALLGATASLLFAGGALADDHAQKSWYVSLGAGLNWIGDDAALGYTSGVRTSTAQFSYDTGHVVAGAIGRDFGTNWRVELEAAFRGNDVDKVCPALTACVASNADVSEFSQMINVIYDVPAAERWRFRSVLVSAAILSRPVASQPRTSMTMFSPSRSCRRFPIT